MECGHEIKPVYSNYNFGEGPRYGAQSIWKKWDSWKQEGQSWPQLMRHEYDMDNDPSHINDIIQPRETYLK